MVRRLGATGEQAYDLSGAEDARYASRTIFRILGPVFTVGFTVAAIYWSSLALSQPKGSVQQEVDFVLVAVLAGFAVYIFPMTWGNLCLRGPRRMRISNDSITLEYTTTRRDRLSLEQGFSMRIYDLRSVRGPTLSGAPCLAYRGFREFGLSGPACDAILATARTHGLDIESHEAWMRSAPGVIRHRIAGPPFRVGRRGGVGGSRAVSKPMIDQADLRPAGLPCPPLDRASPALHADDDPDPVRGGPT